MVASIGIVPMVVVNTVDQVFRHIVSLILIRFIFVVCRPRRHIGQHFRENAFNQIVSFKMIKLMFIFN